MWSQTVLRGVLQVSVLILIILSLGIGLGDNPLINDSFITCSDSKFKVSDVSLPPVPR